MLVLELHVEGNLGIEPLLEVHLAQHRRQGRLGPYRRSREGEQRQEDDQRSYHCGFPRNMRPELDSPASTKPFAFLSGFSARAGSFSASSSIARSIGMRM